MNVTAIKSMEELAQMVLTLRAETQDKFFKSLTEKLSAEEIETLKKCITCYKLMTNFAFYKATQKALGEELYKEFKA
jgi:hypothetical protein